MDALTRRFACFAVALVVLGSQACSTSSGIHATLPAKPTAVPADPGVAPSLPNPDLTGDLVPAIVGIPADPGPKRTYLIGPNDVLKIEVFQVEELSSQERVNEEGFVAMPLIGNVKVGGLTPGEAEQAIANQLGEKYLQNPQVNIFVADYANQRVTIIGEVNGPGMHPITGRMTLMQVIALAGGVSGVARKSEIVVFRTQESGSINAYVVDFASIEEGKLTDPVIVGGDRIVVPKSGVRVLGKTVYGILSGWAGRSPF